MTTCLITRSQPGAQVTEANVRALGHKGICLPAAMIVPTGAPIDTKGVQALLMTSAAAARNSQIDTAMADLPVYAVGNATAEAASLAGFTNVISAGGDGANLAVLAADRMKPDAGALLHLRGNEVAGDVTGMLTACGFTTRHIEVYATHDHPDFTANIVGYLRDERGIVLFHSPAGARRFCAALESSDLDLSHWGAIGLSTACLQPLQNSGFAYRLSAAQPDENALIEAVSAHATHSGT
jgi:uroporphyrinogen-III synthase